MPLHLALRGPADPGVVAALVKAYPAGVRVHVPLSRLPPLHAACRLGQPLAVVQVLLEAWPESAHEIDERVSWARKQLLKGGGGGLSLSLSSDSDACVCVAHCACARTGSHVVRLCAYAHMYQCVCVSCLCRLSVCQLCHCVCAPVCRCLRVSVCLLMCAHIV